MYEKAFYFRAPFPILHFTDHSCTYKGYHRLIQHLIILDHQHNDHDKHSQKNNRKIIIEHLRPPYHKRNYNLYSEDQRHSNDKIPMFRLMTEQIHARPGSDASA